MITGNYNFKGISIPKACVRVQSLTGGENGWTANVSIFASAEENEPLSSFSIMVPYRSGIDPITDTEDLLLSDPRFITFIRVNPRHYSQVEFLNLFTLTERVSIRTAAKVDTSLEDYLDLLYNARFIDLTRLETISGVNMLEAAGLIGVGRAAEVLSGTRPA